jgi:ribonucleotide monophosphatase NagD (HAD superfamily)
LRDSNKFHIKFVTNTTKESKISLVNLLTKIGFDIKSDELFTSLSAARKFVDENNLRPFMFLADEALEDFDG